MDWSQLGALGWMSMKGVWVVLGRQEMNPCKGLWSHIQCPVSLLSSLANCSLLWLVKSMNSRA